MTYRQRLARNIPLFYLAEFFGQFTFIVIVFVAFERQFLTFGQMSLLAGSRFFLTLILELPTGAFADLVGRKTSVAVGKILFAAGLAIIAFSPNAQQLIAGTLLLAIGDSFVSGSSVALVYDSLRELGRAREFGNVRTTNVLVVQGSILLASALSGYLFAVWKGLPYAAYAAMVAVSAILYLTMQEPILDTEKFSAASYIRQMKDGTRELLHTAYTRQLSLYYALVGGLTWAWQIFFNQIYATDIGYNELQKGWLFAGIRVVNSVIIFALSRSARFLSPGFVFLFFPILIIATSFPTVIPWLPLNTFLLFPMTIASSLRFVALDRYVNDVFSSRYRATALSVLNLAVSVFYILVVTAVGQLLDRFPSWVSFLVMGTVAAATILPVGIALARRNPESHPTHP